MGALFLHEKLYIRFLALFGAAAVLFVAAWTLSFLALPDGIIKGRTGGALLAGEGAAPSFILEWLRIAALNLAIGAAVVVGVNLLRDGDMPMGYIAPLLWAVLYAVCLGTNSFSVPLPGGRMAPSLAVLGRSGPYEIAAFVLAAVSTYDIARYKLVGRWPRQRLDPRTSKPLTRNQWLALAVAILMLLAANASEAQRIMATVS